MISSVALIFQQTLLSTPIKTLLTVSVDISTKNQQQIPTTISYLSTSHHLLLFAEVETRSPIFPHWKYLNGLSKSLSEIRPIQQQQTLCKQIKWCRNPLHKNDRGGLHADTVGEPSFHVLGWLTSNFWHIHYIPACRLQIALKWWQLQDSQRGIWPFWQQVAFHLYWES